MDCHSLRVVTVSASAFLLFVLVSLSTVPASTKALPMKAIVDQAMAEAKQELEQQQQAPQHHLQRRSAKEACAVPTNITDMFQKINTNLNATQFLKNAVNNQTITVASTVMRFLGGDPNEVKTCPATVTKLAYAILAHRSLCPYWFDVLELNEGYYPRTLNWAKCKCQTCLENPGYVCETVLTFMAVLKPTGCFQGTQRYEEQLLEVPTSCACAFKGVVQAGFPVPETTTLNWPETTTLNWGEE